MPGNTFGELFRVTTAGVSHGPGYLVIIDGCPPGLPLSVDDLLPDPAAAADQGSSNLSPNARKKTCRKSGPASSRASPMAPRSASSSAMQISRSRDYEDVKDKYRPGHADFTFDATLLARARPSRRVAALPARETICRVAAGPSLKP